MSKKLVVSFPGRRGYEVPLLYFTAKYFEDLGYEKIFIQNPTDGDKYENIERVISTIDFSEFEHVVLKRNLKVIMNVMSKIETKIL